MRKVYDCFLFFNELELLKLRMEILKDVVDYFVIVESTVTFTSKPKELIFDKNKELFNNFKDKIIHVIIDESPKSFNKIEYFINPINNIDVLKNKVLKFVEESTGWNHNDPNHIQWGVETFQRESIILGLDNAKSDDIIIISDVDEIPNPLEIIKIHNEILPTDIIEFKQDVYYYYLNMLKERNWSGPKICNFSFLENVSLNHLRQNKFTNKEVKNGGWHFSFMGGSNKVKEKIEAYSHQEYNNQYIINNISNNINNDTDPFFRSQLVKVEIDESYPKYLLDNLENYKNMIK
jgi:beta-1,4-mannosyl-glycoprotein beta-1,4-N-acetylglucosaminyltransferase